MANLGSLSAEGPKLAAARPRPQAFLGLQLAPTALLLALFMAAPLAVMFGMSFFRATIFGLETTPSLGNYEKLVSDPLYGLLLLKSLRISLTVTVLVLLISYPVAYWLAKMVTRWRTALLLLIFAPYWVNYVIRTYAWMPLLGRTGVVNSVLLATGVIDRPLDMLLFNEFSVQLVMVYVYLPFGIVPIYLSLDRIDDNLLRASADLGASPWASFRQVVLPLSAPGLAGAAMTVFVLAIGAYVTPRLVGGPSGIMYGNLIADQFGASFNWSWGATLSLVLALAALAVIALVARRVPLAKVFLQS
ncbi:ABC transporter permease [Siccirubricoccus phaeus]|uniref:ABC transporter permease n=1 Tax=Siccirubricoccus phaeus TaxID=2595053 RepID=UPI0011F3C1E9|nr:ABC transporter permease [Siccirubricoccus phaeus]